MNMNAASPRQNIRERTFAFACRIIALHRAACTSDPTAREIGKQLLRSGLSIGANLEEADAAQSKADFISKCTIALKEARETHYWLRLLSASDLIPANRLSPLIDEADQLVAILTTIIKRSRQNI